MPVGLRQQERAENFPVALRALPRALRTHLRAVYDVARVIDDLGDEAAGDRTALLTDFRRDLAQVWADGEPQAPVLIALVSTVHACGLTLEPFDRLVQANLTDQQVVRYPTYAALREYCVLSADPVGRLVLAIFHADSPTVVTPAMLDLSDQVCTALQVLEHCQDVAEDRRAGRVYLPADDLDTFGVTEADLQAGVASPALRRCVEFEVTRAVELLTDGAALIPMLHGWARLAVAGYVAGGLAAADAVRRAGFDVLAAPVPARRVDVVRHLVRLVARR